MGEKKLKTKDILGYTIGSIGDSTSYNFVLSFFSFFMITVAGVSPVVAGTIISVAIAWDAITDPIIGYLVDNSKSKYGKRRPWILKSLIPLGASLVLMFLKVDFPQTQKNIYYLILVLVFWTAYTAFNIPYYSFGSVLSDVDSERVRLAAFREVLGYVGIFCASSVPTFIVGRLLEHGLDNGQSWAAAGVISAVISVSTILIMWRCTRGKEPVEEVADADKVNLKGFFTNVISLMKMKPYVLVIICALLTNVYLTLFNSSLLYYVTYNMGLGETQASLMFTAMNIVSILFIPFITKSVAIFSKSKVFVVCMVFSGVVMMLTKFTGISGASAYCRIIDFKKFREIADEAGAYLMVDIAHIAGLVAAGVHPSPIPYAHVTTTTTHKTLRGPRGGMIMCSAEIAKKFNFNKAVFPRRYRCHCQTEHRSHRRYSVH